jgi:hypothetical protein
MEALRVAVHHPEKAVGRLGPGFFSSEVARSAYEELASALTLHDAMESAPPAVAALLAQLAAVEGSEDPDDVLRRILDRAAVRALAELQRAARADGGSDPDAGARLAKETRQLQLALQALRSLEPGPAAAGRLAEVEQHLLVLLGAGAGTPLGTG